jgi:hypothetical protein
MLYSLMDGHARTATELALVAEVSPSTASVHLSRLTAENLIKVQVQGRHRYYSLRSPSVARALERLSVLAGSACGQFDSRSPSRRQFAPRTPDPLRTARTCYDHMAGAIAVSLHDHFLRSRWLQPLRCNNAPGPAGYDLTASGAKALAALGLNLDHGLAQTLNQASDHARVRVPPSRRRFAYACLDWSERRPHLGGALGAALLHLALTRKWLARELDSRALAITRLGHREFQTRFGLDL